MVPVLHDRFPKLELLLVEEKSAVVHQRLRDGQLDVGLLALPVHDDHLQCEPLFTEEFVLAVPTGHPLSQVQGTVSTSVLAGDNVLLLEEGHCLRDQALSVCQLAGAEERSGFRATSLETLRQMVAAGVGVTLLPELAVAAAGAGVTRHRAGALRRAGAQPADRHVLASHQRVRRVPARGGRRHPRGRRLAGRHAVELSRRR